MRAIWKGAVSFGLVNVPVRLFSATENHDVQFRQVHEKDGGRIKYQRVCSIDGEEVPYSDIAKGYEAADGQMVVLTDEDLKSLPTRSTKEISIEKFVPSEQIDPLLFDKSYYLEPDKTGLKPYVLLRDALEKADRMALVTVSVRTRMTLAVLRVRDGVIVLQTLLWADEVRAPEFESLSEETHATAKELAMASSLVDSLSGDYEPEEFEDDYAEAVTQLVATKIEGGDITETPEAKGEETEVVDLLAALQRSVDKAKAAKTGGSSSESGASDDRRGDEDRDEDRGQVRGQEGDDEEGRREEDDGQEDREEHDEEGGHEEGELTRAAGPQPALATLVTPDGIRPLPATRCARMKGCGRRRSTSSPSGCGHFPRTLVSSSAATWRSRGRRCGLSTPHSRPTCCTRSTRPRGCPRARA